MKKYNQQVLMRKLGLTFKDIKDIKKHLKKMGPKYKKMTANEMEVLIMANGGYVEMCRRMGFK